MELTIQNIEKKYGNKVALEDVSLVLTPGVYALLGPNGAGKSTLMNIITENLLPDSGSILCNSKEIHEMGSGYRKILGFVPQQQGLYDTFTAYRFLSYIAALKGMKKKEAKREIERVLTLVNLNERAASKIGSYSGGMKQRLLIAQAIMGNPKILILDEPTAGLDPKERIRIRNIISEIANDKIVIFATHVVSDIEQIAKQVILIQNGKILHCKEPACLLKELEGKVFEFEVQQDDLDDVKSDYIVSNIRQESDCLRVRTVSEKIPTMKGCKAVAPCLEDVYLFYFGTANSRR